MAYHLHILRPGVYEDRPGSRITEEEWREAVRKSADLRLSADADGPQSEKLATLQAELYFPDRPSSYNLRGQWVRIFDYSRRRGKIFFKCPRDPSDEQDPVRLVAAQLARDLSAVIQGDDGEEYHWL